MQSGAVLLAAAGKLLGRLLGAVAVGPAEGGRPPAGGGGGAAAERVRGCRRVGTGDAPCCGLGEQWVTENFCFWGRAAHSA